VLLEKRDQCFVVIRELSDSVDLLRYDPFDVFDELRFEIQCDVLLRGCRRLRDWKQHRLTYASPYDFRDKRVHSGFNETLLSGLNHINQFRF